MVSMSLHEAEQEGHSLLELVGGALAPVMIEVGAYLLVDSEGEDGGLLPRHWYHELPERVYSYSR